jgi:hypothetical protein
MLIVDTSLSGGRQPVRQSEVTGGGRKRAAWWRRVRLRLTDEAAYLQTDDDEKPAISPDPPPDPAWFKCWFCRKSHPEVETLFGAEFPVRDPSTFAVSTVKRATRVW